mgnify:CR=1 FL=1
MTIISFIAFTALVAIIAYLASRKTDEKISVAKYLCFHPLVHSAHRLRPAPVGELNGELNGEFNGEFKRRIQTENLNGEFKRRI